MSQILDQLIAEKLVTLAGISWEQFRGIATQLENHRGVKLTYLSGALEIMSPIGERHECLKTTLGYLLEAYLREKGIRFYGKGGFTLEVAGKASATPDESYCIGSDKNIPDIVIEVIVTSGTLDKREIYQAKKITEVWFWKSQKIKIFYLVDGDYQEVVRSSFFPDLDIALLERYLEYPDQYDAINEFIRAIRLENF